MEIRHKNVIDLTPVEYAACRKANYGPWNGYMHEEITRCRRDKHPGYTIMLWDGPDDKVTSLIGWAIMTPVRTYGLVAGTRYTKSRSKFSAQFWIKRQYRRKGYGTILMNEVKKIDPRPHVFPHDKASGELFSSYDVTVLKHDERHINRRKPKVA